MKTRLLCGALLIWGFVSGDAAAQVYKCRDSAGNITYVDRPCPETEKTEETPPIDKAPTVYPDDSPPPGEKVVSMRRALFFKDDFREVSRGNQRYYVSGTSVKGIYTSAFAEGAAQICSSGG